MIDITNQKFNRLTAVKIVGQNKERVFIWEFKCDCGKLTRAVGSKVRGGNTKSCGCLKAENIKAKYGDKHHGWAGYEQISRTFISRMQNSAKQRDIEWKVDEKYLWDLFESQQRKCALSGREIKMPIHIKELRDKNKDDLASLDRIDNGKGYIKGNLQWVCKRINYMKHCMDLSVFLSYVKDIYGNFSKKNG